jgi:hypothetical protein
MRAILSDLVKKQTLEPERSYKAQDKVDSPIWFAIKWVTETA